MKRKISGWKSSQLMGAVNYEINHYRDKNFTTVNMHSHDFYELYFFIDGSASYIIENGRYSLKSGDVLLISPNNLHQLDINNSNSVYERIVLWINPTYLKKLSTPSTDLSEAFQKCNENNSHLLRNSEISEQIYAILLQLSTLEQNCEYGKDIEEENLIKTLLLTIGRHLRKGSDKKRVYGIHPTIDKAINFINENLTKPLSLELIADALYLNKYYLAHLFKQETNVSPHRYIIKKRLILSKQLIEKDFPVSEVYLKCGFSDYSHFFRAFKQEFDLTPKQYYSLIKA